jgi:hypothetical protein
MRAIRYARNVLSARAGRWDVVSAVVVLIPIAVVGSINTAWVLPMLLCLTAVCLSVGLASYLINRRRRG